MFPAERGTQAARRRARRPRDKAADGAWLLVFFAVVMTLLALLAVLGVTSFPQVKRRMAAAFWTRLQKGAYVFFGLVYLRLVIVLLSSALAGGASRPQPASRVHGAVRSLRHSPHPLSRVGLPQGTSFTSQNRSR